MARWMRTWAAGLCLVGLIVPQAARAQLWPLERRAPGMTPEDMKIAIEQTKGIFEREGVSPGQSLAWTNPASGNSGFVTYEKALKLRGMGCRQLRYTDLLVKPARQRDYLVNWCLTPQNEWKIVS